MLSLSSLRRQSVEEEDTRWQQNSGVEMRLSEAVDTAKAAWSLIFERAIFLFFCLEPMHVEPGHQVQCLSISNLSQTKVQYQIIIRYLSYSD